MSNQMKCVFCANPVIRIEKTESVTGERHFVKCWMCGAQGPIKRNMQTAKAAWTKAVNKCNP